MSFFCLLLRIFKGRVDSAEEFASCIRQNLPKTSLTSTDAVKAFEELGGKEMMQAIKALAKDTPERIPLLRQVSGENCCTGK